MSKWINANYLLERFEDASNVVYNAQFQSSVTKSENVLTVLHRLNWKLCTFNIIKDGSYGTAHRIFQKIAEIFAADEETVCLLNGCQFATRISE